MKILLLGGTGAIGAHLAKLLSQKGYNTHITSRKNYENTDHIVYHKVNAKDFEALQNLLKEKWDVIVDFMVYSTNQFKNRINILLKATNQYIFISSSRVYASAEGLLEEDSVLLLDTIEDDIYLSTDEYALSKARQEDVLKSSKRNNWTIIRPYITYSESRLQLGVLEKEEWLYRALKGRTIVFSEDIVNKITTLTYGYDVSNSIAELIGKKETLGEVFHVTVTSRNSLEWSEVLGVYCNVLQKHLGYKPKVLLLKLNDFLKFRESSPFQITYDRLYNREFNTSKIGKFVEVQEFMDPLSGLRHCLLKFLQKPSFTSINWKMEALRDKYTKEWTPLNEIEGLKGKLKYLFYRYC